jgi:hypothetical protein
MHDAFADLAKKTESNKGNNRTIHGEGTVLAGCYGQIGISAVAAAARYQGSAKNPVYAPASSTWRERLAEAAASRAAPVRLRLEKGDAMSPFCFFRRSLWAIRCPVPSRGPPAAGS